MCSDPLADLASDALREWALRPGSGDRLLRGKLRHRTYDEKRWNRRDCCTSITNSGPHFLIGVRRAGEKNACNLKTLQAGIVLH